jgi:molecular chaperone GrpE (heat shock protein)
MNNNNQQPPMHRIATSALITAEQEIERLRVENERLRDEVAQLEAYTGNLKRRLNLALHELATVKESKQ